MTFSRHANVARAAFIDRTALYWDYSANEYYQWFTEMHYRQDAIWGDLDVRTGRGTEYLSQNYLVTADAKLVVDHVEWGGWLVCDWSLGVPELFWVQLGLDFALVDSCATVDLNVFFER